MQIEAIIERLDALIRQAAQTGNKYDFIDPAFGIRDELADQPYSLALAEAILRLLERSPDIDYGGPGPLGSMLEGGPGLGYEAILLQSLARRPTRFTLFLLHRVANVPHDPDRPRYIDILRTFAADTRLDDVLRAEAAASLALLNAD